MLTKRMAAFTAAILISGSATAQEVKTLTLANWVPPTHHVYQSLVKLAEETERVTNGTLKIEVDKAAVASPGGMLDIVQNGVRDMSWDVTSYYPGLMERARVVEVPFLVPDAGVASRAMHNWYFDNGFNNKEWDDKGVVLLNLFVGGGGQLLTSKHKVVLPDDAVGIKVRAAGPNELVATTIGMVPVSVPASKVQETLQRGAADGAFFSEDGILAYKLGDYIDYVLEMPGGFAAASFYIAINADTFNDLSEEHQAAMRQVWGVEGAYVMGGRWQEEDQLGRQAAVDAGIEITVPDEAQLAVWQEKLDPLAQAWVEGMNNLGEDGQKIFDDFVTVLNAESAKAGN